MAATRTAIRSQINIKIVSDSVTSLSKGVDRAQKSASSIGQTLITRNKFKREAISRDKLSFFQRRDAVRRKEQEGIIEAGQLRGAEKRTAGSLSSTITESTKGFLGRIMDFVGTLFVGWLVRYLPSIIQTAKNLIIRIQTLTGILGRFVVDIKDILFSFVGALDAVSGNILGFNFSREDRDVQTEFEKLNKAVSNLGVHFDEAVDLLKTPLGQGPGEEEKYTPPSEQPAGPQSRVTYYSEGGKKITDVGGKDYGAYAPEKGGSRASRRVHGAYGEYGHAGEDYAMAEGTPLSMVAPGKVVDINTDGKGGGYGNFVIIKLDSGEYVQLAHLSRVNVSVGDKVGSGSGPNGTTKVVAFSGSTGRGTGPHLHMEYGKSYDGRSGGLSQTLNPKSFADSGGIVIGTNVKSTGQTPQQAPSTPSGTRQPTAPPAPSGSSGAWKPILDVISEAESRANGYNAIAPGDYNPRLSQMTIAEANKAVGVKGGRGAIGRYQLTNPIGQAAAANLKPSDLFSPANQDKIAIKLAENRGVTLELISKDPIKAGNLLAGEWAGLPVLSNYAGKRRGQSYYEGYKGNSATISAERFEAALKGTSRTPTQTTAAQVTPQTQQSQQGEYTGPLTKEQALAIAQISQPTSNLQSQIQSITPERAGTNVVVTPQQMAPQTPVQTPSVSSSRPTTSEISPEIVLNRFMVTRFLLDLAYT